MNRKEECEIVKDLAQQYIEKSINEGSENFVKNHLETCGSCKKYYENMESQVNNENDNIVINQFKKVNRYINILKISLITILTIIVSVCLIFFVKAQIFKNVVNTAYEKVEYMKQLDNYKLIAKTTDKKLKTGDFMEYEKTYYYKNGKYKIEDKDSVKFYEDDSYEKILAYHNLKSINYYQQDFIEMTKGKTIGIFTEIINYNKLSSTIYSLGFSVREERYNGIDCYVIKDSSDTSYRETWISKENFITLRVINEDYTNFYREVEYIFEENVVTDEDVDSNILNSDKYKDYKKEVINNNATEEIKLYYEIYNRE